MRKHYLVSSNHRTIYHPQNVGERSDALDGVHDAVSRGTMSGIHNNYVYNYYVKKLNRFIIADVPSHISPKSAVYNLSETLQ